MRLLQVLDLYASPKKKGEIKSIEIHVLAHLTKIFECVSMYIGSVADKSNYVFPSLMFVYSLLFSTFQLILCS